MPTAPTPDELPLEAVFARPGDLPGTASLAGQVAVLDLAFNSRDPQADLEWARSLGNRLAVWIDHHDQAIWARVAGDPRFVLVPRAAAPACPPLVTAARVRRFGPADTILAHGDTDGVLSAAKWMVLQEDLEPPAWIDPDGILADTRRGRLSTRGERLDRALRASSSRNRIRRAVVASVLAEARGQAEHPVVAALLDRAFTSHERIRSATLSLAKRATALGDLAEDVAVVDLRALPGDARVDLTELSLTLQEHHDWVLILGRFPGGGLKVVATTACERTGLDLRREFGLTGFAPFRVHVPVDKLLARLPSEKLQRALEA